MGWWPWSSSDASSNNEQTPAVGDNAQPAKRDFSLTDEQRMRIFGRPGPDTSSSSSSRDDQADSELASFLKEIGASPGASPDGTVVAATSAPAQKEQLTGDDGRPVHADGSLDISPEALLPRTMSCRQAFDQAFYCQSLGGKFNDIYRYGHLQSCSDHWSAFWFCMRTRTMAAKEKEGLVKSYYRERDGKRKKEYGSSEDVWDLRERAVERAFWRDPDEDVGGERGVAVQE